MIFRHAGIIIAAFQFAVIRSEHTELRLAYDLRIVSGAGKEGAEYAVRAVDPEYQRF